MNIKLTNSESSAGSFRLSANNSIKRVRTSAAHQHCLHPSKDDEHNIGTEPQIHGDLFSDIVLYLKQALFPTTVTTSTRHSSLHAWSKFCLKWLLAVYCVLSFIVFSFDLYTQVPISGMPEVQLDEDSSSSAFDDVATSLRLSRLFSLPGSDYLAFDPLIIRAKERTGDVVSACLWTDELLDFEMLRTWVTKWQGPVSLVMTTTGKPDSRSLATLLHRLHDLSINPLSGLTVHLLRFEMHNQASSNSYLNLARFFASTSVVMLVPDNISRPPPMSHDMAASLLRYSLARSSIVTGGSSNWSDFSKLPQLSPIILPRDHPIWCTERFFLHRTRSSEWAACLWQHWLHSFGDFVHVGTGKGGTLVDLAGAEVSSDRLSIRFKVETCDLLARSIATLGLKKQKDGKKKLQWLKETCGQNLVDKMFKSLET